jgi:hypothetical protein
MLPFSNESLLPRLWSPNAGQLVCATSMPITPFATLFLLCTTSCLNISGWLSLQAPPIPSEPAVWYNVIVVGKLLDGRWRISCPALEFCGSVSFRISAGERRFPISSRMMRILNSLDSKSDQLAAGKKIPAMRWPVKDIRLARPTRRRNPFRPSQIEMLLVIALTTGMIKKLGEKLSAEAFDWVRDCVKRKRTMVKKERKPKRK